LGVRLDAPGLDHVILAQRGAASVGGEVEEQAAGEGLVGAVVEEGGPEL
jgi:hypothetical protein